jgi:hypothetical protein
LANFTTTHWVFLGGAQATGTSLLTWTSVHDQSESRTVIDNAPQGEMNAADTFSNQNFTGFYIVVDGRNYGVFRNPTGSVFSVPYNKDLHDIWGSAALDARETTSHQMPLTGAANCFLEGTHLATPDGPRRIETLAPGDLVSQASGPPVPILWLWRQEILNLPLTPPLIRLCAHALGPGNPAQDLVVTPDHALGIAGFLVTAQALLNGTSIRQVAATDLPSHYILWHVETTDHCLLLAEGCPAESFLDYGGRHRFDGHDAYLRHHGQDRPIPEMPLPRITCARQLPPLLRARLGLDRVA